MSNEQWAKDFAEAMQQQSSSDYGTIRNLISMARQEANIREHRREKNAPINEAEERLKLRIEMLEDNLKQAGQRVVDAKEQCDNVNRARALAVQKNGDLIAERDELTRRLSVVKDAVGAQSRGIVEVRTELAEVKAKLTAAEKDRDRADESCECVRAEYQSVKADRDGLLRSLNLTTGELNKLSREHKDTLVNHDALKANYDFIKADRDNLLGVLARLRDEHSSLTTRHELLRLQHTKLQNERKCVVPTDGVATEETKGEIVTVQGELIAQSLSGVQIRLPSGSCLYVAKEDLAQEKT